MLCYFFTLTLEPEAIKVAWILKDPSVPSEKNTLKQCETPLNSSFLYGKIEEKE